MRNLEQAVTTHYGDTDLLARIFAGLKANGVDLNQLQPHDLTPVEEFHIGGRAATAYIVEKMGLTADQTVLDVGCTIGGTARYIATHIGGKVCGVDITPEFVSAAKTLTRLTHLDEQIKLDVANALNMPYDDRTFDAAITIHVAMNIEKRALFYSEIARVMKPGATFGIFDVMKHNYEDLVYPVPWAKSQHTSYLATVDETCAHLAETGFEVIEVDDRTEFALSFFYENMQRLARGLQPLGVHIIMGEDAVLKMSNTLRNIESGSIAPVQIIARRI